MRYMLDKELEETKEFLKKYCLQKCGHNANESCICKVAICFKEIENTEQALLELQAIKEAKPSKFMKYLDMLVDSIIEGSILTEEETLRYASEISQALLKAEKLEKSWEVVKEKEVDIRVLNESDNVEMYNEISLRPHLIENEFTLLKEMLG